MLTLPPLQTYPIILLIFLLLSAVAGWWVYADSRKRLGQGRWEVVAWSLGTVLALPIFLPIYLIAARPLGHLTVCSNCGWSTPSHRAICLHCGNAIAFDSPPAMWGLGEVIGLAIVFMVSLPVIAASVGIGRHPSLREISAFAIAQNLLFAALTVYVVRYRYRLALPALGIRFARWPTMGLLGLVVGAATIPTSIVAERVAVSALGAILGRARADAMASAEHARDVVMGVLRGPITMTEIALVIVLVCLVVPLGEEIFFRGFVYGALRQWGTTLALALSATFFAAVHQQAVHFLPIFVLGLILAIVYERTQSLLPGVIVHAVNNLVAILTVLNGWNI